MALGTITPQPTTPQSSSPIGQTTGNLRVTVTNVVGDSSYPTGGSALTPAQLNLTRVIFSQTEVAASTGTNCASTGSAYNATTGKLVCFANSGAEVSNATNLSGLTWQIIAWGI